MKFPAQQIRSIVVTLLHLCSSIICCAQHFSFETLTQDNILDKQAVLTIAQDQQGKLWFGGGNNLFIYDSRNVTNVLVTDSIFKNVDYINKININSRNDLFIATATKLFIFNIDKRKPVYQQDKPFDLPLAIHDIYIHGNQTILCSARGLYLAIPFGNSYTIKPVLTRNHVQAIVPVNSKTYAVASDSGIEFCTLKNNTLTHIDRISLPLKNQGIVSSLYYQNGILWIGTKLQGLFQYRLSDQHWQHIHEGNSNLLSNNIRKINKGPNNTLMLGTLKGLSVFTGSTPFINYKHNTLVPHSLSQNSIYDIFVDDQQIIWLGTYFGGINAIYPNMIPLHVYSSRESPQNRLNSDIIGSFAESPDAYWIGTEEEGINLLDKKTGIMKPFPQLSRSNLIKDLSIRDSTLYAAQHGGGYSIIDLKTKTAQHVLLDKNPLHLKNNIYSIYAGVDNYLYLGTNAGLYIVPPGKPPYPVKILPTTLTDIQADNKNCVYFLLAGRLYKQDPRTKVIRLFTDPKLSIQGFYVHPDGDIWFTTATELYHLGDIKPLARFHNNTLGWPVMIDKHFWISSKNGLIFLDPTTKYTTVLNQYDGFPVKNMQGAKVYSSDAGVLFVTTLNGLVSIDTRKITFNQKKPNVLFRNIFLEETPLNYGRIQQGDHPNNYRLQLRYDENFITVNFSSSNFIKPHKNRYRYKLEGFDKDWIETSTPSVRYTNIPEGRHILSVYASNNDGIWSSTSLQIHIDIKPPLWRTWWAYLLYAGLFTLGVHFVIKFVVERQMLINSEREQEKKIKFFTQISHEIRTPLTLITAPLDEIISETANLSTTQSKIKRIKKNAAKLLGVVNELLDFKKFDDKHFILKQSDIPFREYIEDTFYLLNDLAQNKHINYYIRQLDAVGLQSIDAVQFDKVMFNLLSNAIKYTPENGTVYLELLDNEDSIIINIVDNGIGISTDNQFKIFEEYYREEQANDSIGTGIGLALTKQIVLQHQGEIRCFTMKDEKGEWTVFNLRLPKLSKVHISSPSDSLMTVIDESNLATPSVMDRSLQQTILIVEDNRELLDTIVHLFQDSYTVITAVNGEDALSKAQEYIPDLILSDLMMPYMNGAQLCQAVKTNIATSHIPVILLTAVTDSNSQTQALQYGANIYLTKPFDNRLLFLSVQNLIAISHKKSKEFQVKKTDFDNELDAQFIATLDQLIEDNMQSDNFDVNFISRKMGMSTPIIYRKLRAISNLSINNYVKMYRLNRAKELLRSSMNISEVAYAVGFSERKYFSREFKKQFGYNPSEQVADSSEDD
ncbi:hybrid sensor histidine kinase/response regulator transcription factor [Sphingobacterium ginsenosidimutans]|uniref:histidine kinase n=1 Tax=Sphingobacterium ginsenosidimutans TaxID=687845 RepID=A0ABP8APF6_9SPHI